MRTLQRISFEILIAASLCGTVLPASAQNSSVTARNEYPIKPVRIITGPPAAFGDIITRHLAQGLYERWGYPVVVENRPRGMIGAGVAAKAAPDGYTLLIGDRTWHAVAQNLYKELPYDPVKDFAEIAL